jgi:hypothetical protein
MSSSGCYSDYAGFFRFGIGLRDINFTGGEVYVLPAHFEHFAASHACIKSANDNWFEMLSSRAFIIHVNFFTVSFVRNGSLATSRK